jgi:dTDP-glucose 4,6-dehydratase
LYRLLLSDVHDPVNLGNPAELTILELAEFVNELTENSAGIEFLPDRRDPNDPQQRQPNISLANAVLSWEPGIDLKEGLTRTIEDFEKRL